MAKTEADKGDGKITIGRLSLDLHRAVLHLDGEAVNLRPQSFEVLRILAENNGSLVEKRALIDSVWGDVAVTDDSLTQCLADIRRALSDSDKTIVRTIPRRGYVLEGDLLAPDDGAVSRATTSPWKPAAALAILAALAVLLWQKTNEPPVDLQTPPEPSIAVLPFADMTAAQDMRYLGEGLSEEILNILARSDELRVIARTSSFQVADSGADVATIARTLNVSHVIEGSVRQGGDRLRITVQLIDAADNSHLWSEAFDRPIGDILDIQSEIARAVADELRVALDLSRLPGADVNPRAHALVIQARSLLLTLNPDDNERAQALLREARAIDPGNVDALLELARATLHSRGQPDDPGFQEAWLRTIEFTEMALAIDAEHPVANAWRGYEAMHYSQNYRTAARYLERAMDADPRNVEVLTVAINGCIVLGCYERAIELGQYAVSRDPLCINCFARLSLAALLVGNHELADASVRQAISIVPDGSRWTFDGHLARNHLWRGDAEGALNILDNGDGPREQTLQQRVIAYAMLGRTQEFEAARQEYIEINRDRAPEGIAAVEAAAGNVNSAFEWLARNVARPTWERGLNIGLPYFDSVRDDPRWQAYLEQLGLSDEQRVAIDFDPRLPY